MYMLKVVLENQIVAAFSIIYKQYKNLYISLNFKE